MSRFYELRYAVVNMIFICFQSHTVHVFVYRNQLVHAQLMEKEMVIEIKLRLIVSKNGR